MEQFPKKSWRTKLALAVTAGILAAGYVPHLGYAVCRQ